MEGVTNVDQQVHPGCRGRAELRLQAAGQIIWGLGVVLDDQVDNGVEVGSGRVTGGADAPLEIVGVGETVQGAQRDLLVRLGDLVPVAAPGVVAKGASASQLIGEGLRFDAAHQRVAKDEELRQEVPRTESPGQEVGGPGHGAGRDDQALEHQRASFARSTASPIGIRTGSPCPGRTHPASRAARRSRAVRVSEVEWLNQAGSSCGPTFRDRGGR